MDSNPSSGWGSSGTSSGNATSGWGATSAPSSGWNSNASGWGRTESSSSSSAATATAAVTNNSESVSVSEPKQPISSWARAVSRPNNHVPCNNSRSHCDKNSTESSSKTITELEKEIRSVPAVDPLLLQTDCSWGQTVINQDKGWDQPSPRPDRHSTENMWKSSLNTTGTEIWENSVRHKNNSHNKQPDAAVSAVTAAAAPAAGAVASGPTSHSNSQSSSWNHTPATHIGGTWGEEEDSSSMWSGVPHANGSSNHSHSSTSNASNGSWGANRPADTAITSEPLSSGWKGSDRRSDVPDMAARSNHLPNHNNHNQQQPALHPSSSWNGTSSNHHNNNHNNNNTGSSLNWDEQQHQHHQHQQQPSERMGTSGWSAEPVPVPKPTLLLRSESQPVQSGWKKESGSGWDVPDTRTLLANGGVDRRPDQGPGAEDRSLVDDGTAAWGNPVRQPAKIHRWKDEEGEQQPDTSHHPLSNHSNAKMPAAAISANGMGAPLSPNGMPVLSSPGMIRLPPSSTKEAAAWVKSQPPGAGWPDQWNEEKGGQQQQQRGWGDTSLWNQRKANWSDGQVDTSSWNGPKHKPLTKEMICASKQFRLLSEMGFRKEDVESSLRSANMNEHEALSELRAWSADERRKSSPGNTPTTTSLLLTSAGPNTSLSGGSGSGMPGRTMPQAFPSVNEVTSALRGQSTSRGISGQTNVPSEKQLLHLVQQIQLAVQSGHLNAQILNQPLAPPTIQLIYTLLQQIKHLQTLQIQVANSMSKPGATASLQSHLHVQITETKRRISNCQNQIAVQQALFMKHQQPPAPNQPLDFMRNSDVNSITPDFRDMSLKDQQNQNQSRFKTTWKLPSFEKEEADMFSRAPGGKSRPDTWSGVNDETGLSNWSDGADMFKETSQPNSSSRSAPTSSYLADLVPEFEPGKPWKGSSQMKSIEDDPHVTPGSVNRSPLSVNTIFNNWNSKVSPTDAPTTASAADPLTALPLCSSTWAYPSSSSGFTTDPINSSQKVSSSWSVIGEPSSTSDSLWSSGSAASKPRGPPPGLSQSSLSQQVKQTSAQQQQAHVSAGSPVSAAGQLSFWDNSATQSANLGPQQQQRWSADPRTSSGFLVLRNLTPQMDGSTLKTLCQQHGPVHLFHLLLQSGMCLVSYSTQEEANKAQNALNNCVLGNTTILCHVPTESELKQLINQVGQTPPPPSSGWSSSPVTQNGGSGFRPGSGMGFNANGNKNGDGSGQWGGGGGGGSGTGLWNYSSAGSAGAWDDRGSGSGLQSNLDDLLGGESSN